jgi:outer membrane protein insertion porin family
MSERLFLDGSSQLRGYAPGALAPAGANFEAFGRAEVEAPLWPRAGLSAVAFYDVGGMAYTHGIGVVGQSVGFGLLWRSPIGPLCFDWAVPLDGGRPAFLINVGGKF